MFTESKTIIYKKRNIELITFKYAKERAADKKKTETSQWRGYPAPGQQGIFVSRLIPLPLCYPGHPLTLLSADRQTPPNINQPSFSANESKSRKQSFLPGPLKTLSQVIAVPRAPWGPVLKAFPEMCSGQCESWYSHPWGHRMQGYVGPHLPASLFLLILRSKLPPLTRIRKTWREILLPDLNPRKLIWGPDDQWQNSCPGNKGRKIKKDKKGWVWEELFLLLRLDASYIFVLKWTCKKKKIKWWWVWMTFFNVPTWQN